MSKLFTTYALLVKAGIGIFDTPVTDYLPELRRTPSVDDEGDLLDHIRWEEISIGALASHQAGSGGAGSLLLGQEEPITPQGKQYCLKPPFALLLTSILRRLAHSHARCQTSGDIPLQKRCLLRRRLRSSR